MCFILSSGTWGCVMWGLPFVPQNVVVFRQRHKRDCLENAAASCPNRYDDGADSFSSVERRTRCVYSDYRLPYHTGTHWIPPPSVHRPPKASFVLSSQQSPPPSAVCLVALIERVAVPRWNWEADHRRRRVMSSCCQSLTTIKNLTKRGRIHPWQCY